MITVIPSDLSVWNSKQPGCVIYLARHINQYRAISPKDSRPQAVIAIYNRP